jgi:hypothetical protein
MPPWRKGRGLGPFTAAQPAAGPLLGSQPHAAANHPEQPLSAILATPVSTCGAWPEPLRAADAVRLPTDIGPPTGRTRLALSGVDRYGGGSVGSRSKARSTGLLPGPDVGARPAAGHVGWESMHRQLSAASPGGPVGRLAVASGPGSGVARGVAATLRRCGHMGWNTASRFGAGLGGYSCDAGNKPQPSAGPSPRPALTEVARQPVRPVLPLHSAFGMRSSARQRLHGLPARVPYGTASAHRHPARVWHPERH